MHPSLDQRFSRAGFNGIASDSERTVSRKPNSLDYRVTIKNDVYGPPPSALRAKRNPASGSRPVQITTNNNQTNFQKNDFNGKRFTGDFQPLSSPSNRTRGPPPTDWSGRPNPEESFNRGRARMGPFSASNSRGADVFRGRHIPQLIPNLSTAGSPSWELTYRPNAHYGVGRGQYGFNSSTPRKGVGAGTAGRLAHTQQMRVTSTAVGSARYEQPFQNSGKLHRGDRPQCTNSVAFGGDSNWVPANRYPKYNRSGRPDWFGRPRPRGGGGPQSIGGSGVWMHDDRLLSAQKQSSSTTGNRFTKRSVFDRKYDAQAFMSSNAMDEYIDDFTPEDLAKYKLEINLESFTVDSPLLSDPILRTPLSKWGSNELHYSPERDLFALHTPDLDFDLEDDGWPLQQPSRKPRRPAQQVRAPLIQQQQHHRHNGCQHTDVQLSSGVYPPSWGKSVDAETETKAVTKTLMNIASDQTSESTDKTFTSINTSSTHQTVDDSGLGESIKPLSSTKSCEDLISDSSSLLQSTRDSDLYRCGSCPDSMHASRNSRCSFCPCTAGAVIDNCDDDDKEKITDEFVGNTGLNRTRSCCLVLFGESPKSSLALRRTQSIPSWYPGLGLQMNESRGLVVDSGDGERS